MSTLTIHLLEQEREEWEQKAVANGFKSAGEYVIHLARESQQYEDDPELEAMLTAGVNSGRSEVADETWWAKLRQEVSAESETAQPV